MLHDLQSDDVFKVELATEIRFRDSDHEHKGS